MPNAQQIAIYVCDAANAFFVVNFSESILCEGYSHVVDEQIYESLRKIGPTVHVHKIAALVVEVVLARFTRVE